MVINEQDSGFFQWCFHLLDFDSYPHSGYQAEIMQCADDGIYYAQYHRDHDDTQCNYIENDEIIARTLQEEFSRLAVTEGSEFSHAGEEHLQSSIDTYDLHSSSTRDYCSADQDESDDMVPSSSCSSPGEEEYPYHLEQFDEYVLDGEVGKRLNQMIHIPHVPRINGDIPSIDEATSDHERLLNRLQLYDFVEVKVQGDGNCQLKTDPEIYEGYVPMEYGDYVKKMSRSGEWGDHVTLQAAADSYGMKIFVITSFKDTCYIEILPKDQKIKKVIFLSFWAEVHYNSINFQGAIQSSESRKKKSWWRFGN